MGFLFSFYKIRRRVCVFSVSFVSLLRPSYLWQERRKLSAS